MTFEDCSDLHQHELSVTNHKSTGEIETHEALQQLNHAGLHTVTSIKQYQVTRMWANAQRDGALPNINRWRPPFNAAKFG